MFKPIYNDRTPAEPWEYLPASAITPKMGMALKFDTGKLAICGATDKPEYIGMVEKDSACTAGDLIPVIRVHNDMTFETTCTAAFNSVKLGEKVTLHSDGLQVTATVASGVAEVVGIDGTAAGSTIRVRF